MFALLHLTGLALAQGYSADIELLSPGFGAADMPGVSLPATDGPGAVRAGLQLQYLDDPLTIYDAAADQELGAVVARRATAAVGLSWDLSSRFTLEATLPTASSWASELPELAGDRAGTGDLAVGARWVPLRSRSAAVGLQSDLRLPTSPANAWLGERGARLQPALLASVDLGPITLASATGAVLRTALPTSEDLVIGPELTARAGARVHLPAATRTALTATVLSRAPLEPSAGPGAVPVEALTGLQIRPTRDLTIDLAAGRGLTEGYGTTDLRVHSGVRLRFRPPPQPPEITSAPPPPPPPPPERLADAPDPPVDFGERRAVVTEGGIAVAQQPRFEVDTAILLEQSRPLLAEVAALFRSHPELGHVVIVGHASQEGSHGHNYALSLERAHAIWRALVELGVDADRISIQARGEVEPLDPGTSEAALERNRRVVFRIVHRWPDPPPPQRTSQPLPWSGAILPLPAAEPPVE